MSIPVPPWTQRKFRFNLEVKYFPLVVERLRGMPVRLTERSTGVSHKRLTAKPDGNWSIQENIGHLLDLESLWATRLTEILKGVEVMTGADMSNRATEAAKHNSGSLESILSDFANSRTALVDRLSRLDLVTVEKSSFHPRLETPMRVMDLGVLVAEHDDHHMAIITRLLETVA